MQLFSMFLIFIYFCYCSKNFLKSRLLHLIQWLHKELFNEAEITQTGKIFDVNVTPLTLPSESKPS